MYSVEITVEKDKVTGETRVLSSTTVLPRELLPQGIKVYEDETKGTRPSPAPPAPPRGQPSLHPGTVWRRGQRRDGLGSRPLRSAPSWVLSRQRPSSPTPTSQMFSRSVVSDSANP